MTRGPGGRRRPSARTLRGNPRRGDPDYPDVDVRIDLHPQAVTELRRVLQGFKLYEVFYRERGRNPRAAITQDEFVARLEAQRHSSRATGAV